VTPEDGKPKVLTEEERAAEKAAKIAEEEKAAEDRYLEA
jgi:hypothetical protein